MERARFTLRQVMFLIAFLAFVLGVEVPMYRFSADMVRDSPEADYIEDEAFMVWIVLNSTVGFTFVLPLVSMVRGLRRDRAETNRLSHVARMMELHDTGKNQDFEGKQ